jgi:aryl-alcohol dehydrogenase-like predicted oxidoreductase
MMDIRRRDFLESAVAGTAGVLAVGGDVLAAPAPAALDPLAVVPLGKHLKVTRIGLGTGMRGGMRQTNHTRMGHGKFNELVRYVYDQGVRLFDAADLYGTHTFLAQALQGKPRDSYSVNSKYWFRQGSLPEKERPDVDVAVKRFLRELRTDYIDLLQLHCVTSPDWNKELRKQMDLLEDLKRKGIVRAHGISCHSLPALETAADEPWVDVIHARINPAGVRMDLPPKENPLAKVVPVLKRAHDKGKGIIGMKIIGEGTFGNDPQKREESARFVLGLGCVDVLVIGFEKTAEFDDFLPRVRRALAACSHGSPLPRAACGTMGEGQGARV